MERKLAPSDGIQVVDGKRFLAVKGEPLMEGAEFTTDGFEATEEAPKPKAAKTQTGPTETTNAAGPTETAKSE